MCHKHGSRGQMLPSGAEELLEIRKQNKTWNETLTICFDIELPELFSVTANSSKSYDWRFLYKTKVAIVWNSKRNPTDQLNTILQLVNPVTTFLNIPKQKGSVVWWGVTEVSWKRFCENLIPAEKLKHEINYMTMPEGVQKMNWRDYGIA